MSRWALILGKYGDCLMVQPFPTEQATTEQIEATQCGDLASVLKYLLKLQNLEIRKNITFLHNNHPSISDHMGQLGFRVRHECSLGAQIAFVQQQIDQNKGVPSSPSLYDWCIIQ